MDEQSMSKEGLQRIFWRENQVTVTFHSDMPLVSTDGINNAQVILHQLDLPSQVQKLNQFLKDSGIDYTLSSFTEEDSPQGPSLLLALESAQKVNTFTLPPGVYIYDQMEPIQTNYGLVQCSVVTFFNFTGSTGSASENTASAQIDEGQHSDPVVTVVNGFNQGQEKLNRQQVPISAASPVWLCGGTPLIPQGCPLTPPIPLEDSSCAYWHYRLPYLSPKELRKMNGEGVTVLILDTLPERNAISDAVHKAGDDNLLLLDVSNTITYNYNFLSPGLEIPGSNLIAAGKDVYGKHILMKSPDHGLFIAGIIHDIAPRAKIECIRVLDDYCVGDSNMFLNALQSIENRMLQGGDLYQKPVVINMSLVIPSKEEAKAEGLDVDTGGTTNDVVTNIRQPIQSLLQLGAIITASAGNDFDLREKPTGMRPPALYPAAFANPPDSMDGIIPVGAVNKHGKATSYSCYPGSHGIATYGGEVPRVEPPQADPSKPPVVTVIDAVRGIYSSSVYPALVAPQPPTAAFPVPEYPAPDDHAWAYWVGTSFATPVITALAARVLEMRSKGAAIPDVRDAILAAAGAHTTDWDRLDPATTGVNAGSTVGPLILARQTCMAVDEDEEEEE